METLALPLFDINETNNDLKPHLQVREEQIITPLNEILEQITPKAEDQPLPQVSTSKTVKNSLDELFPEQQYDEKNIQKAKEILGDVAKELSPEQLKDAVTEIQFLAESWLDDFERKIFKGLTLQELLHEKGGV